MEKQYIFNFNHPITINLNGDVLKDIETQEEINFRSLVFFKVVRENLGKTAEERFHLEKLGYQLIKQPDKVELNSSELNTLLKFLDLADINEYFKGQIERYLKNAI